MALLRPRSLSSLSLRRLHGASTNASAEDESNEAVEEESAFAAFDIDVIRSFDRLELVDGLKDLISAERVRLREAVKRRKQEAEKLRRRWEDRRRKLQERLKTPDFIAFKDKASFVLGLGALLITEGILMKSPQYMWAWYLALIGPLLIARYVLYRKAKYQYFCYDFCYAEQLSLCLALLTPLGRSVTFHRLNFAVSNGPLAFAVAVWGNSLVFHSLDKQTSLFIHLLPPVVTYCLRWHGSEGLRYLPDNSSSAPISDSASSDLFRGFFSAPLLLYIIWQGLYLIKTEIVSKKKLERDEKLMTSKRWLTKSQKGKFYKLINYFGPRWQTTTFVLLQLAYTILTLLPTVILYKSQAANCAVLLSIFCCCLWNGANYYFEVFASRYMDELQKLRDTFEKEMKTSVNPGNANTKSDQQDELLEGNQEQEPHSEAVDVTASEKESEGKDQGKHLKQERTEA